MIAREALAAALDAYAALEDLGASIEDEWQYVTDLAAAYRAMLEALAERLGDVALDEPAADAVEQAIAEISLISDPHRAIDWLSTFPHVVAFALGAESWEAAAPR